MEALKKYLSLIAAGLVVFVVGLGMGYYFAPSKTTTIVDTDNKKTVDQNTTTTVDKKIDPTTGKVIEVIETTKKDNSTSTEKQVDKTKITEKSQKHYAIKAGPTINLKDPTKITPRIGGEVALPFFSSWLGVEGDIDPTAPKVGAYLRLEF